MRRGEADGRKSAGAFRRTSPNCAAGNVGAHALVGARAATHTTPATSSGSCFGASKIRGVEEAQQHGSGRWLGEASKASVLGSKPEAVWRVEGGTGCVVWCGAVRGACVDAGGQKTEAQGDKQLVPRSVTRPSTKDAAEQINGAGRINSHPSRPRRKPSTVR
ncbi:hypothetical protein GGTG_01330 [Gaeumannomyces tritici R3-111a-1]|uniref:Uncharacterized protein n=1 Tax=Gaeumannomyces tritici (strain R3-111a-1) TaxID=644352 RepID=J3NJ96_GAET3|nr:hypothetical protein GGTG_01330 [Gaeumannomyces tritici R3-111a-1]EJT81347.1 hypothetical protein GGTG_01330 [Gaeumannomyces tritici R3-111a-1]